VVRAPTVTQGPLERAYRRQAPGVSGTPPPYAPALDHRELGTGAGQPVPRQVWHLGEHLADHSSLVPRGVVDHQHHCGLLLRRRGPRAIAHMARNPCLQAARPRSRLLPGGMGPAPLHEACGQVPSHQVEGPADRDPVVAIPMAHQGARPCEPQGCPPRREQRAARFILAPQDECPRVGFVFQACRSGWAVCCGIGSAVRYRDVGREGRTPWVAQKARIVLALTAMPWVWSRWVAHAAEVAWARSTPQPTGPGVIQVQIVEVSASGIQRVRPGPHGRLSPAQRLW
jgi:hypothetical protein